MKIAAEGKRRNQSSGMGEAGKDHWTEADGG